MELHNIVPTLVYWYNTRNATRDRLRDRRNYPENPHMPVERVELELEREEIQKARMRFYAQTGLPADEQGLLRFILEEKRPMRVVLTAEWWDDMGGIRLRGMVRPLNQNVLQDEAQLMWQVDAYKDAYQVCESMGLNPEWNQDYELRNGILWRRTLMPAADRTISTDWYSTTYSLRTVQEVLADTWRGPVGAPGRGELNATT